ncbi:hypothetical protein ACFW1A_21525 [Kitasatospora sp. NPDC058965]|uniref:hypothetical protein n=1 Tax=Kitasatospora sp. NPDC058965 TaxID=3346682 RepID=UPI00369A7584
MSTAAEPEGKVFSPNTGRAVPERDDWAVMPVTKAKLDYARTFPADWEGQSALHHKISKEKLSSVAEQIALLHNSETKALKKAVQEFWALCCRLAGPEVTAAVMDAEPRNSPHRLLWNLPLNVSIGPQSPVTDPGQAFDPDTEPVPHTPGLRQMDAVSTELAKLEALWDKASQANEGLGDFTNHQLWTRMTTALGTAYKAADAKSRGGRLLYPPKYEQWLCDGKQFLRKGLTDYVGVAEGQRRFAAARRNVPSITAYKGSAKIVATGAAKGILTTEVSEGVLQDTPVTLTLTVTEGTAHHICERHTFTFFDFRGTSRPINTIWEKESFAEVTALANQLAAPIANLCLKQLLVLGTDDPYQWMGEDIELSLQPAGEHCVYFHVTVGEVDVAEPVKTGKTVEPGPITVTATVKTFAPNGASGPGFLRQELVTIGQALGAFLPQ